MAFSIRGTIEHEHPSCSWFGSFFWSGNIVVSDGYDVLIRKDKIDGLVTLHGLMGKVVKQETPLDDFLGHVLDVILG